jgi:general secretion pathway protein G
MKKFNNAFTMIELVFVIVILGILSAIAIPRLSSTKNAADIAKGRTDVSAIRSSIMTERQSRLILGTSNYIPKLCSSSTDTTLFLGDGTRKLLTYGIVAGSTAGKWSASGATCQQFNFKVNTTDVLFIYNSATGTFTCDRDNGTYGDVCKKLID